MDKKRAEQALKDVVESVFLRRLEIQELEKKRKSLEAALKHDEELILEVMDEFSFKSLDAPNYGKVTCVRSEKYAMPRGKDKDRFFDYLKKQGCLESLATVGEKDLQRYVKYELEKQARNATLGGPLPEVPGLAEPFVKLSLRATKSKK